MDVMHVSAMHILLGHCRVDELGYHYVPLDW